MTQLRAALDARAKQRSLPLMLKAIGLAIGATALLLVSLWVVFTARGLLRTRVKETVGRSQPLKVAGLDTRPLAMAIGRAAIWLSVWGAVTLLVYLWLVFVLGRLPYTEPWGERLAAYLIGISKGIGLGVVKAAPDLFTVLVTFLLARVATRLVGAFFQQVEDGKLAVNWLPQETAQATRRLVVVLIWAFTLILAYPYIPGSDTEAFKGVSVVVGLMVTLGSGGLVSQVLNGLVVVYSRAFQAGRFCPHR